MKPNDVAIVIVINNHSLVANVYLLNCSRTKRKEVSLRALYLYASILRAVILKVVTRWLVLERGAWQVYCYVTCMPIAIAQRLYQYSFIEWIMHAC